MQGGDQADQDVRDDAPRARIMAGLSAGGGGSAASVRGLRRATATPTSASAPPT